MRALVATSAFGALKDEPIRDRIVCGIYNNTVRRKLLQDPHLSLSRCIDLCRATETTTAQVKAMSGQTENQDLSQVLNQVLEEPLVIQKALFLTANSVDAAIKK